MRTFDEQVEYAQKNICFSCRLPLKNTDRVYFNAPGWAACGNCHDEYQKLLDEFEVSRNGS